MPTTYMLDTCICSYIMKQHPVEVLQHLDALSQNDRVVISAITYSEMRYGQIGKKAPAKLGTAIDQFVKRLNGVLPWDASAVDMALKVRVQLASEGTPIGSNDAAIAAHAIVTGCTLVTHNVREFSRVAGLTYEDWA
ncbi:twitching motility protein PilT [Pokkaliibacter plantistimulans]|uniref:Ribonuclease VapC n=1 Tax=Pokkaliibacter plantistimulans TaxID=1635171 RepID=A0ABX5LZI6_9GAMM|nr:type II toxin-antitoxin system VapC family toxin [Pokkaliibacter plantistimulans]PXF32097.1 twitching motility protein PilT [Pokkaliibacter plantistimulans]